MTALLVHELASGISDGLNCLAHIQSLRAEPPIVSAAELSGWHEALDRLQDGLKAIRTGQLVTTLRVSGDLLCRIDEVRAQLSAIAPGARLGESLFDLADVACAELGKAMASR